jgi:hypothetical protein
LSPKYGQDVFKEHKAAVQELMALIKDKKSTVPAATIVAFIQQPVALDRTLASVASTDALGGDPTALAKANDKLAKGDSDVSQGKYDSAIDNYLNA